jgi:transcriptional regulator with XRE-family HTH domain
VSATETAPRRIPPVREYRERQGLGLRELARRAKVDPAHLSAYERGKGGLSSGSICKVLEALGQYDTARLISLYHPEPS